MDDKEYLSKAEFYQYMGDFRQGLEQRLTKLEGKISCNNTGNKEKLVYVLIGAVLILAGATAGTKLFGGLF
jgi:hypothetical protein